MNHVLEKNVGNVNLTFSWEKIEWNDIIADSYRLILIHRIHFVGIKALFFK
jgi:hypothetical protein